MQNLSGQTIKGYELRERIGTGGFGAVYRAYQPMLKREVAVKVILPEYASQPEFIRRFEVEAELVARLEHPYIIPLFDYWRGPDGAYLVMRWLRGGSLRDALNDGACGVHRILQLLDHITAALHVAHRKGVVHRDIKPDNILLDEDGNAYLADFGIAKSVGKESKSADEGVSGSVMYTAPEQLQSISVSPQTDIYSLGITTAELLTGSHPFEGSTLSELIFKHLKDPFPILQLPDTDVSKAINHIIQKMVAKDPSDRFADVREVATAFRAAIGGESAPSPELYEDVDLENPYKGLRAFQEYDSEDFFGRDDLTERLLEQLNQEEQIARFLAVVGPSGSGKSSVVKAGLIPAIRKGRLPSSDKWFIVEMFPGAKPFGELEAALVRVSTEPQGSLLEVLRGEDGISRAVRRILPQDEDTELLLIIDQFEELFTLTEDESIRSQFLESLLDALEDPRSRLRVIVTLRADFYDRPLQYRDFGEVVRKRLETVLPMSSNELEASIVKPAEKLGAQFEPGLVQQILAHIGEQPGALPLLQYALTELFAEREGNLLTHTAYQKIGGAVGALASRADEIFNKMHETEQEIARQMFLRLVTLGEGTPDSRRRVVRSELTAIATDEDLMEKIIDTFAAYRFLSLDIDTGTRSPTVEVAHEAILREWERLRQWINEGRENIRAQQQLSRMAEEWLSADRDVSFLARGLRLEELERWSTETDMPLTEMERTFLNASIAERRYLQAREQERQLQEAMLKQRAQRTLQVLAIVFAAAAVIATGLSVFAFDERDKAQNARATSDAIAIIAERSAEEVQSFALANSARQALRNGDTDLAIALALEAYRIADPPQLVQNTLVETTKSTGTRHRLEHSSQILSAIFSPDGSQAASGTLDNAVVLWDVTSGEFIRRFEGHTGAVNAVDFNPDMQTILSGSSDKTMILWDVPTGRIIRRFEGHTSAINSVIFSLDGSQAVSGSQDQTIILWDVTTGDIIHRFEGHTGAVKTVVYSPDNQTILSGSADGTLILWDVTASSPTFGEIVQRFEGHTGVVTCVAISPNGARAVSGSTDRSLIFWDLSSGQPWRTFWGHTDAVTSVAFGPDSLTIASGSDDNTLMFWQVGRDTPLHILRGHQDRVTSVAFSPDGTALISGSKDQTLRLWDSESSSDPSLTFSKHTNPVFTVDLSSDGKTALSAGGVAGRDRYFITRRANEPGELILWDVSTREIIRHFEGHEGMVSVVEFSPDGQTALSGDAAGTLILWDVSTGEIIRRFEGHTGPICFSVAFSPDGKTALSGSTDRSMILWDVSTGEIIHRFEGHSNHVCAVAFSPDGKTGLSGSPDRTMIMWDLETGEIIRRFEGHTEEVGSAAISPNGQFVLSGSADRTMILWDVNSGEPLHTFVGHGGHVMDVVFSPDGQRVLSSSGDDTMIMWDVNTGEIIRRFEGHTRIVRDVAVSTSWQIALSASDDGTVRIWPLSDKELVAWVEENHYVREFTCEEREIYRIEPLCEASVE